MTRAPILEFDRARRAVIEPSEQIARRAVPRHCVLPFFLETIRKLRRRGKVVARTGSEAGTNPMLAVRFRGRPLAVMHAGVGGPLSGAYLEEAIAWGCRRFVVVGSAGSIRPGLPKGAFVVPTAAIRDEGTSYHYLAPCREVRAHPAAVRAVTATLSRHGIPFITGKTWTTDAFYRETPRKVRARRGEGCVTVEMEAASLLAVARFRRVRLGILLYRADDVSGGGWDVRDMRGLYRLRDRAFRLAAEACLAMR
jgi:purine-nucleoside phosphorylase